MERTQYIKRILQENRVLLKPKKQKDSQKILMVIFNWLSSEYPGKENSYNEDYDGFTYQFNPNYAITINFWYYPVEDKRTSNFTITSYRVHEEYWEEIETHTVYMIPGKNIVDEIISETKEILVSNSDFLINENRVLLKPKPSRQGVIEYLKSYQVDEINGYIDDLVDMVDPDNRFSVIDEIISIYSYLVGEEEYFKWEDAIRDFLIDYKGDGEINENRVLLKPKKPSPDLSVYDYLKKFDYPDINTLLDELVGNDNLDSRMDIIDQILFMYSDLVGKDEYELWEDVIRDILWD